MPDHFPPMPKKADVNTGKAKLRLEADIRAIIESNFSESKKDNQDIAYHLIMEVIELYMRRSEELYNDKR